MYQVNNEKCSIICQCA